MVLGLLAIQIILAPLLFYGILYFIEGGFQSQFVDQVRKTSSLFAAVIKPAVMQNDISTQKEVLSEASLDADLVLAELVYPDGTFIRPWSRQIPSGATFKEDFGFGHNEDKIYYIAMPIVSDREGEIIGSLRFGYDELPTQARIDNAYRYGSLLAFTYALFSILTAIFFGRRLIKPVSQLQDIAKSIASGETDVNLTVRTDIHEISSLASDLDRMRRNLLDRHRDVMDREKRLYAILDNAGEGIISLDSNGVIGSFNQAAESIFGWTTDQVVGTNVSMLAPLTFRKRYGDDFRKYLAGVGRHIIGAGHRVMVQKADGRLFPVFLTLTEILLDQEKIYICIVRDLTKEEEKEEQLLKFWRIVEQSPIAIIITDKTGTIEYVNPYFCKMTGYPSEEAFGVNPSILKSGNTSADTYRELWITITNGAVWRGEFQNRKKNGELYWESATICPVHDRRENITHYVALKEDITEHREKDRMLNQAMKMEVVGRMTDGIAHDFNNLLTIILGNLQYLKEDISKIGRVERLELIEDVLSAAHDGSNLIKQLLIFSRRGEPDPRPMELGNFMKGTMKLLRRTIPENISLKLEMREDIGTVLIDANRLESAVLNLVINARDAMPDGGNILIDISQVMLLESEEVEEGYIDAGDYVFLRIIDDGFGMTEEIRKQVLEPFFTTKPGSSGTGLGLSMVNDLLTKTGGGIRIDSDPGIGTTVTLILPLYEKSAELSEENRQVLVKLPGGSETILVVEDRENVRRFAGRILSGLGYQLIEAENAAIAVELLQSNNAIDLLFTDIVMPGEMNGRQLARHARTLKPTLRILLTTGAESQLDEGDMKFPLLNKPYSADQVARAIRSVLDTGDIANC